MLDVNAPLNKLDLFRPEQSSRSGGGLASECHYIKEHICVKSNRTMNENHSEVAIFTDKVSEAIAEA